MLNVFDSSDYGELGFYTFSLGFDHIKSNIKIGAIMEANHYLNLFLSSILS